MSLPKHLPASVPIVLLVVLVSAAAALAYQWHASGKLMEAVEASATKDPRPPGCQKIRPSALATRYLDKLHGVEIGASTQNSFGLKRSINVDYSDEQGGLWQQKECEPAVVNLVAQGDDLPFKDNTLDYVVSSHVIEHFFDPVKALREWHRVIRPGGYIFVIAPHRDRTFDKVLQVTPVQELIDRSTGRVKVTDYLHPLDQAAPERHRLARERGETPPAGWGRYKAIDYHHWSIWRTEDFVALVKRLGWQIVEIQDVDDKLGNGFTVVIRK